MSCRSDNVALWVYQIGGVMKGLEWVIAKLD